MQFIRGKIPLTISSQKKGRDFMNEFLFFIIGAFVGSLFGVFFMCLFQINRKKKDNKK